MQFGDTQFTQILGYGHPSAGSLRQLNRGNVAKGEGEETGHTAKYFLKITGKKTLKRL